MLKSRPTRLRIGNSYRWQEHNPSFGGCAGPALSIYFIHDRVENLGSEEGEPMLQEHLHTRPRRTAEHVSQCDAFINRENSPATHHLSVEWKPARENGLLTPGQEIRLAQQIERGDRTAKERLVTSNLRLVTTIAKRYQGRGLPLEDLIQEGALGLIHAAEKFDWRKRRRFSTYATYWIQQAILLAIITSGRSVRLPAYVVDAVRRLLRLRCQLENTLGRLPTSAELAQKAGIPEQTVTELLQSTIEPLSLEAAIGAEGDRILGEFLPAGESQNPSARLFARVLRDELVQALGSLTPREQQVVSLRYGLQDGEAHTLAEVGKALRITRERARQLEQQGLERLRDERITRRLQETLTA